MLQANPEAVALAGNTAVQAAVALLILKEVFAFIRCQRKGGNGIEGKIGVMYELLTEDDDDTGAKRWNIKPYANAIKELQTAHEKLMAERHRTMRSTVDQHTATLAGLQATCDLLGVTMGRQTEILEDIRAEVKS